MTPQIDLRSISKGMQILRSPALSRFDHSVPNSLVIESLEMGRRLIYVGQKGETK